MEDVLLIKGGNKLTGSIEVRGAKNSAFAVLFASLLTKEPVIVDNLPLIEDVFRSLELLKSVGADIEWLDERKIKIHAKNIDGSKIDDNIVCKFRGSVLMMGALLGRERKVSMKTPGGCIIGARPIDTHLDVFSQMGCKVEFYKGKYRISFKGTKYAQKEVILNELSVTATENAILFASSLPKKTIIKFADFDYPVQSLVTVLKKAGAKIKLVPKHHTIEVEGSKKLKGFSFTLPQDPLETGSFILLVASAKGDALVKNINFEMSEFLLKKLKSFGLEFVIVDNKHIRILPWKTLKIDKVQALPYPGLSVDLLSSFGVLATQTPGSTLLHDPLYEGRFKYLEELNKMGAEIYLADPHRAIVNGPSKLEGVDLLNYDLRGGFALLTAGVIAKGKTTVRNVYQIYRGYENIEERLKGLGIDIQRIKI